MNRSSSKSMNDGDDENEFAFEAPSGCFSMMTFSNDDDDDDIYQGSAAELQDSLAASNALVGENLVESPAPKRKPMKRSYNNNMPPPPPIPLASTTSAGSHHANTHTTNPYHRPSSTMTTTSDDNLSVGIMAHGLAWVARTRESRRRRYLQHLAEQQLEKLKQAAAQEEEVLAACEPVSQGLFHNSTFQSIMSVPGAIHNHSSKQPTATSSQANPSIKNSRSQGSSALHDAAGGGIKRRVTDAVSEQEDLEDMGAVVSQSGSGYSFNLPLSAKEEEEAADFVPPVRVHDEEDDLEVHPLILSPSEMQQIAQHVLPTGIAYCKWTRLYSLVRDGDSFDACLRLVQDHARTLMVIRTSRNQILGGFADQAWRIDSGGASYYGGPDACLFKVDEAAKAGKNAVIKAFKWTGSNRYIQLCDHSHNMLAFGGGGEEGAFGLSVEQDFLLGSTGHCATFDNEPLCDQDTFEIVDLEIFGFLIGQF